MSCDTTTIGSPCSRDAGPRTRRPGYPLPADQKTAPRGPLQPRPAGLPERARQELAGKHLPNPTLLEYNGFQQPAPRPNRPVVRAP